MRKSKKEILLMMMSPVRYHLDVDIVTNVMVVNADLLKAVLPILQVILEETPEYSFIESGGFLDYLTSLTKDQ